MFAAKINYFSFSIFVNSTRAVLSPDSRLSVIMFGSFMCRTEIISHEELLREFKDEIEVVSRQATLLMRCSEDHNVIRRCQQLQSATRSLLELVKLVQQKPA